MESSCNTDDCASPRFPRLLGSHNTRLEFGSPKQSARRKKLITVGIHGNEISGIEAVQELYQEGFFPADTLPHESSSSSETCSTNFAAIPDDVHVTILLGNPEAYGQNKRFLDVNLNRLFSENYVRKNEDDLFFKSNYEMTRLHEIANEIESCDEYLDIHSTSSASPPFAIPADNDMSKHMAATLLPVDFVIEDLSTVLLGTTVGWAAKFDKTGVCIECGSHYDRKSVDGAKRAIKQFVSGIGADPAKTILSCRQFQTLKDGFTYAGTPPVAFAEVSHDQLIAIDKFGEIRCPFSDGAYVIMPTANPIPGEEAWFWGHRKKHEDTCPFSPVPEQRS